jgi:hypothetical protein
MELLRFDHLDDPHPVFEPRVQEFESWMATVPVVCGTPEREEAGRAFANLSLESGLDLIAHA